ncbi:MAG TPA: MBG domain-containing protein, partial [Cyclobacteriaceae bacterium]
TVTADPEQTKNYGSSDPVLTYQVTPALIGGDTFTGVLERAAGEDVDTYEINNGTLDGGGNYTITFEISNFTITPKTLSVTGITISNKEYDGTTDAIISGTPTLEGIVGSDVVSLGSGSLSANFEDANAGSGKNVTVSGITLTGTNAGNYTLSTTLPVTANITPRAIAVTANTNQSKTYGSSDPILTYQVTPSLISGDTFTGALSRGSGENTGTYSITMSSLSAGGNYTITFVGEDFTITPLAITVTANPNQNKVFGSTDPALTYSVNPSLVAGDSFTGQLSRVVGENAGSYAISIGTLSAGSNYQTVFESGNFIIEKASHTITFDLIEDRFNTSEPFTVNATAGSGLEVMFNILSGPATVNGSSVTLTGETGTATIRASSEDENHLPATADQSFEITLDPVLGMEETWKRDIVIFPVPSDGMITIRSGEQEMQKVFLLDISGKLIWKSSQEKPVREMEIEIQEKGEFLVFIQTGKGMISRKIIKY